MRLRPLVVLIAASALSACAGSAPVAEAPPPRPPAPRPPVVEPPPPEPPVAVVAEPEVAPPPSAPRGTVATRATYPEAEVTEWVLTSGSTVVFRPMPALDQFYGLAIAPASAPGSADLRVQFDAPTVQEAVASAGRTAASGTLVVIVGPGTPDAVGAAAGRAFGMARSAGPGTWTAPPPRLASEATRNGPSPRAHVDLNAGATWEAVGTAAVVAVLVEEQLGAVGLRDVRVAATTDGLAGMVGIRIDAGGAALAPEAIRDAALRAVRALRPSAADVARGRTLATAHVRTAAGTPGFWLDGLADLYRTAGEFRPSRDPATATPDALVGRIARVSERAVADLAARLAAAPPAVTLTGPDY